MTNNIHNCRARFFLSVWNSWMTEESASHQVKNPIKVKINSLPADTTRTPLFFDSIYMELLLSPPILKFHQETYAWLQVKTYLTWNDAEHTRYVDSSAAFELTSSAFSILLRLPVNISAFLPTTSKSWVSDDELRWQSLWLERGHVEELFFSPL